MACPGTLHPSAAPEPALPPQWAAPSPWESPDCHRAAGAWPPSYLLFDESDGDGDGALPPGGTAASGSSHGGFPRAALCFPQMPSEGNVPSCGDS